jgi:hypothetical protein
VGCGWLHGHLLTGARETAADGVIVGDAARAAKLMHHQWWGGGFSEQV